MKAHKPTSLARLSITLLVVIVGVPAAYILLIGTWGTILIPFIVALYAAPLFLLNYVIWGRWLLRRLRDAAQTSDISAGTPPASD